MKRTFAVGLIFLIAAVAAEVPTWELGNGLAAEYNLWVSAKNRRNTNPAKEGTLDAGEFMQWQRVKAAWRRMEKQVDAEYRGER
jgi:hypothetical protein